MIRGKILVIGASGQIGAELTLAFRKLHGNAQVVVSDLREQNPLLEGTDPYVSLEVMNKEMLYVLVIHQNIPAVGLMIKICGCGMKAIASILRKMWRKCCNSSSSKNPGQ